MKRETNRKLWNGVMVIMNGLDEYSGMSGIKDKEYLSMAEHAARERMKKLGITAERLVEIMSPKRERGDA